MERDMSIFILQNVSKVFKVEKTENIVLKDINLELPDHGLVSIVGKSGSGKSTLLNILSGIEKPTSGKVLYLNKDISKFNDKKFSRYHLNEISMIFQHYNLFENFTAFENVILPLRMMGMRERKAKKEVEYLFKKLRIQNLLHRGVKNLSGGEKQRVAILRSLITNPKVILCDEPTGALDHKNSIEIMNILKDISSNILVIMVSHNNQLVNAYSDQIIRLKDGSIYDNVSTIKETFTSKYSKSKYRYKNKWISMFLKKNIWKNRGKNLFSIISCAIGFASMFISVGFSQGSEKSQKEAITKNLSIGYATISKIESVDLKDSPLSYQKTSRPNLIEVDKEFEEFKTIRYEENISYLISSYPTCIFDNQILNDFQMVPLYDLSLQNYGHDLLLKGSGGDNSFDEIVVNQEFSNLIGGDCLNKRIVIKNSCSISFKTYDEENPFVKDQFIYNKEFQIVGIVKEFPFLNTPKIYYSYKGGRDYLKSQRMENLSNYLGYPYSYLNYLIDCESDDEVTSYSSYVFLSDLTECERFFSKISNLDNKSLEVTSSAYEIQETYITFISSFRKTLYVFVIIAFVGINFILGMISLSTFLENRKNTAIMTCIGSRNSSIYNLYLSENFLVILISFISSIFLASHLQTVLNPLISSRFSLTNLISIPFNNFSGIRFGLVITLFLIAIVFSTLFTLIPMLIYRHGFIAEELRDE